jgi:hypothetical protein
MLRKRFIPIVCVLLSDHSCHKVGAAHDQTRD